MRLMRRSAAARRLSIYAASSTVLGVGVVVVAALSGPALAAATGPALASTAARGGAAVAVATPPTVTPGTAVTLRVTCGNPQATAATLTGTALGLPAQIPMNSPASGGGVFTVTVTLPSGIRSGRFSPTIACSDGSSATASVRVVTAIPTSAGAQAGDETTSTATNAGLSAAGLALIAVGVVAGGIALRNRSGTRSRP